MKKIFVSSICLFIAFSSFALTTTWTRTVNVQWDNAGNWDVRIPLPGDDVIIDSPDDVCRIQAIETHEIASLTITEFSSLQVRGVLTVSGITTLEDEADLNTRGATILESNVFLGDAAQIRTSSTDTPEITINGDIDFQALSGVIRLARNEDILTLNGDLLNYENSANNFSKGEVYYTSNSDQHLGFSQYRNLFLSGTGKKIISDGTVNVSNRFRAGSSTISITDGTLLIDEASDTDFETSTLRYERGTNQAVRDYSTPVYNFVVAGSGTKSLAASLTNFEILNDLTIESGRLNIREDTVTIGRDFTNNGTFRQVGGTIIFNGDTPSSTFGTSNLTALNLVLQKSSPNTTTFNNPMNINPLGEVKLSSSNDNLILNNTFRVNADASGYATIAEIPIGSSITGNVIMEGYFNATARSWWHVSTPVNEPGASLWLDDIIITGDFTGNRNDDIVGEDLQSMYSFDETSSLSQNDSWIDFPSANSNETMEVGRGYRVFIRDDASTVSPKTIDLTGALNQGDLTIPLTHTNTGDSNNDGWNLIGNPYPATLNWGDVNKTSLEFDDAYVWNANTKTYDKFGPNITVAPYQAFFVKAESTENDLQFSESMKTVSTPLQRTEVKQNIVKVELNENNIDRPFNSSFAEVILDANATDGIDKSADAGFLSRNLFKEFESGNLVDIASLSGNNRKLKVNSLPESVTTKVIPLHIELSEYNEFNLIISKENFSSDAEIFLQDTYLNQIVEMETGTEISYPFITSNDEASKASQRFNLQIGSTPLGIEEIDLTNINIYPNPVSTGVVSYNCNNLKGDAELSLYDIKGKSLLTKYISTSSNLSGSLDVTKLEKGIYTLILKTENTIKTEKLIIE